MTRRSQWLSIYRAQILWVRKKRAVMELPLSLYILKNEEQFNGALTMSFDLELTEKVDTMKTVVHNYIDFSLSGRA
jgi:hypothetical protein